MSELIKESPVSCIENVVLKTTTEASTNLIGLPSEVENNMCDQEDINSLLFYGIDENVVEQLKQADINSMKKLEIIPTKTLLAIGLSSNQIKQIQDQCEKFSTSSAMTANETVVLSSEEEDPCFQDVNMLLKNGVEKSDVRKLKQIGINTVKGVRMALTKNLLDVGFSMEKIRIIQDQCVKLAASTTFTTALEVRNMRQEIFKISTGSKALDKLMGGGIEAMSITEVFGEFGSGKSQLAHTLCVTAQMPNSNRYFGGKVIFIDTENTFRPDRLRQIAERFNLEESMVLENVIYARAYNSDHQLNLLTDVALKLHEEGGTIKLLIVDSIIALLRAEYNGIGDLGSRQNKLSTMMLKLQKMSEEYNIAVFITNQITCDLSKLTADDTKPVGGNIIAHCSTTRIAFKKASETERFAYVVGSPDMAACEVKFAITKGGIDDIN